MLLHMTARPAWEAAQLSGRYSPPSLVEEGFIHCSTIDQLQGVANRLYRGLLDRVVLEIDPEKLDMEVRWEGDPADGGPYPHLYGALAAAAVVRVIEFPCGPDGSFKLPAGL